MTNEELLSLLDRLKINRSYYEHTIDVNASIAGVEEILESRRIVISDERREDDVLRT
jgi:hypothetical protein